MGRRTGASPSPDFLFFANSFLPHQEVSAVYEMVYSLKVAVNYDAWNQFLDTQPVCETKIIHVHTPVHVGGNPLIVPQ